MTTSSVSSYQYRLKWRRRFSAADYPMFKAAFVPTTGVQYQWLKKKRTTQTCPHLHVIKNIQKRYITQRFKKKYFKKSNPVNVYKKQQQKEIATKIITTKKRIRTKRYLQRLMISHDQNTPVRRKCHSGCGQTSLDVKRMFHSDAAYIHV